MPKVLTRFSNTWLENRDENGHQLKLWCKKDDTFDYAGFCMLCQKTISSSKQGYNQLKQQNRTRKHVKLARAAFSTKQSQLITSPASNPRSSALGASSSETIGNSPIQKQVKGPTPVILAKAHLDQVIAAEVIWTLKMAANDFSFSSCDDIGDILYEMYPNPVFRDFNLASSKASYLISHGIRPYFTQQLVKDLKVIRKCVHFTLRWNFTS